MIGALKGTVAAIDEDMALIDVGGVGYEIHAHSRLLSRLAIGEAAQLSIETYVREDALKLFAFETGDERRAFRLLQTVQGVGAKHALAILNVLAPDDLYDAVAAEDIAALSQANGVGRKLAQRLATELQSKLGALAPASGAAFAQQARTQSTSVGGTVQNSTGVIADAVSALVNLGYDGVAARRAVKAAHGAAHGAGQASVEALIKAGLKELAG